MKYSFDSYVLTNAKYVFDYLVYGTIMITI